MLSGILLLDKPEGLSSNAALQRVKRLLGASKAGHVGSLDPLATGMLPICLGEATKVAGEIVGGRKRYAFEVALGSRTDTGDREGEAIETAPVPVLDSAGIERVLERFRGPLLQVPPMYSAIKRGGQPLYRLARAGIEIERAPREIEIHALSLIGMGGASGSSATCEALSFEALTSKGTYIRVLAEDIARALGTCGHVIRLRRLSVAPFEDEPMLGLDEVEALCRAGGRPTLIAADRALDALPPLDLPEAAARRILNGQAVEAQGAANGRVRLYDERGRFLGLGEADGRGTVRPKRMFLVGGGGSG
ncbi:MAG TPA: tRNA pseudouridine(55) synthase TruB [Steroidobacteraceae bacterium]|nr:tRNA pseudouridine(55) synthase TruB [Steroidobacteraceae bacterium]